MNLYPLLFKPIHCPKIWGSESWQLSAYGDLLSEVSNGYLAENTLPELIEIYMDELVGEHVYERYGNRFPLLFKFIDAQDDLSIQVHPADTEPGFGGKTEMWYVTSAKPDAQIVMGFAKDTSAEEVQARLQDGTLPSLMQYTPVVTGDVAFIPAGRIHALCRGTQVAEIQQNSDTTYRLYDYDRRDAQGNARPLHLTEALQVLDYKHTRQPLTSYDRPTNGPVNLADDPHFTTNLLAFDRLIERDYATLDSFVVYMCVRGAVELTALDADADNAVVHLPAGTTVLLPASLNDIRLRPTTDSAKLLEVYLS